jgi:protoporphyrinogen oxidase
MDRRQFLISSLAGSTIPFWLHSCNFTNNAPSFPVIIHNDFNTGHKILDSHNWKKKTISPVDVVIVGGGVAGLSAAITLDPSYTFALYELSDHFGGSSSALSHQGIWFSQGAHYDLDYPGNYGEEVLRLLESLGIIQYQSWNKMWSFVDDQHLIPDFRRQKCFDHGRLRDDVIPEGKIKKEFVELMMSYSGQMIMPTRLIDKKLHHLNHITFIKFLEDKLSDVRAIKPFLDYHMKDDWGAGSDIVSALAGIHYFACRPYYQEPVNVFSPTEGNAYFIKKLAQRLGQESLNANSLVSHIEKTNDGYLIHILKTESSEILTQKADQVIFAGQKHTLKYIASGQESIFGHEQAPWMIVNFICDQKPGEYGYWQNEYLGVNESFMGFIDSSVQEQSELNGKRVFTGYYCLKPSDRNYLADIDQHKYRVINETKGYIEEMLGQKIYPEATFIKVMGHAMPIPEPGYLLKDANVHPDASMIYAGVDNGRLPLLFEAIDSGIKAGGLISS